MLIRNPNADQNLWGREKYWLALEREAKEHEQWKRDQEVGLENLEEELRVVGEKGEAV